MTNDDMTLVREFAANQSEPAFAALVERHIGLVHSAALRQVGDAHLAEEITQAVFIILARKAGSLGAKTILSAWLYRTTRYAAADALKTRRRRAAREQEAYMQSTVNQPDADSAWTQLAPLLDDALAELGETDRAALVLRFFENKTAGEIAAALRMKEEAAQRRVTRALEKLRAIFVKRGVTLTATVIAGAVMANSVQAAPAGLAVKVSVIAAKGTVATAVITMLVNGTLKAMTWAKTKIAVFFVTAFFLALSTTIVVMDKSKTSQMDAFIADPELTNFRSAPPLVIVQPTHVSKIIGQTYIGGRNEVGKLVGREEPMILMLSTAYDIDWPYILFTSPTPTNAYDYLITVTNHTKELFQAEIQRVTGYAGKKEMRTVPVLVLKATVETPKKMKTSSEKHSSLKNSDIRISGQSYYLRYQTMRGFCNELMHIFGKPVFDETDISNQSDIFVDWQRNRIHVPKGYSTKQAMQKHNETLKQAIHDQLGLELISTNRPIEMLVVEKVK